MSGGPPDPGPPDSGSPGAASRPRPRAAARAAALLVGAVGALALAEIALRVAGIGADLPTKCLLVNEEESAEYHCYPSNPSGEFRRLPDVTRGRWSVVRLTSPVQHPGLAALDELPWCVEYRRETGGLRGPAVSPLPGPGVVRIAGMGDSFALGEGVPFERTLFAQTAALLGPGVEILNGAESGLDTEVEVRKLAWMVPQYGCSRAIVVFTLNDVPLRDEGWRRMRGEYDLVNLRNERAATGAGRPWWRAAFRIAEVAARGAEVRATARDTVRGYLDAFDPAVNAEGLTALAAHFRRLARGGPCPAGLVVYPMMYELGASYPLRPCHERVVALAREAGLPVLDLLPAFEGEDASDLHVHEIDHHPNGRAHAIAARAVADWIRAEPTLRW